MTALAHLYLAGAVMTLLLSVLAVHTMSPEERLSRPALFALILGATVVWPVFWVAGILNHRDKQKGGES